MIRHRFYSFSLLFLVVSIYLGATDISCAYAAQAQKPPVAQKQPVAQKPPVARKKVTLRSYDSSITGTAITSTATPAGKPVIAYFAPSKHKQAPPANTQSAPTRTDAPNKPTVQLSAADAKLQTALETFAKTCVSTMNRQRRPGLSNKEIKRRSDGAYEARYMAIDPDSLSTSFSPTDGNKTIKYIGRMHYHEVEYVSIGKDQKQALAGPFSENNRESVTELIKFKSGRWSY